MSNLTWKEFKELAEKKGVTDDMKIDYIDISYPTDIDVRIGTDKEDFHITD